MIEKAYTLGESLGLLVWCHDQAGPFQTKPYPGSSWQPVGQPARQPYEYLRHGTAKLLTLFHPASGQLRATGVTRCPNEVLQPWLKQELAAILAAAPAPTQVLAPDVIRSLWVPWYEGLSDPPTLPDELSRLRMLLVLDNLKGHKSPDFVRWCFDQGIALLYTPLSGSWLNMAESVQRIIERRALEGQHPADPAEIIGWLEATVRGWNQHPTPFVWGGKRAARRDRARKRRYALGGSGACTRRPVRRRTSITANTDEHSK